MDKRSIIVTNGVELARQSGCRQVFLFLDTSDNMDWFSQAALPGLDRTVLVVPANTLPKHITTLSACCAGVIRNWSGNQSRFSRIKYAFLQAVIDGLIQPEDQVVCILGPGGKSHLDTITIHDLGLSWSEEFPFDVKPLIATGFVRTIMAMVDIALDLGALGREGKPVGTIFVVGDSEEVLEHSHQAVFNPFKGYDRSERAIDRPEVVESLKELARLDGAIIISADGYVEAAGRHLDARSTSLAHFPGLGARHRAGAGITVATKAVALVVSESTGKLSIFQQGNSIATLEPLISRRVV